ncbi:MAG: 4-hydroxy-3-methylbut-2-enyl diphosphate reductase [Candidatus Omnitrophica bacterium]|nr:4-hydroxy-3-methylbut-2-enyl diphosphate reductase [Candidatus Omnitrophota bacterium]MBU1869111.1 4-hydroxy-3-methylbut-2-enyl diphosphate reductase [Candidatus Omnitrophota bacterium]
MIVNLAKSAGFCSGVKRAIDIALKTADSGEKVYMLGDIVHNEDVVRDIQQAGIKKINRLGNGKGKSLLIRAHGSSLRNLLKAIKAGYKIFDATCPMVKEIHRIAKEMESAGFRIIIIGDKDHDEVRGIAGQLKQKAIVIDNIKNVPQESLKKIKKACVVVQSTQNIDKALQILGRIKPFVKDLRFFNTICRPTRLKQNEIKALPVKNNVVIVIGSRNSANTKRLYEISKSLNKNTYRVNSKEEIRREWFRGAKKVGITAGASTPDQTTQEIIKYIKQLGSKR